MNVKNRKCIRKLSWRSLWASRKRNIIAIIAIALTALLFTSLFTIVMSINSSYEMYTFRQVGGYCHGTFKEVTEEQIKNISAHSNVKAVGKRITIGYMNSGIFAKTPAEVSFMDDNCTEWSFAEPTTGHAPQGRKEITMDTHALKLLGVEPEVGAEIELTYTVGALSEIPYEKTDTFTLAGWWEYDDISPVHYINISEEYAKEMETEAISKGLEPFRIDLNVMMASSLNIRGQMEQVDLDLGYAWDKTDEGELVRIGVNWGYTSSQLGESMDATTLIAILTFLALVIFTGYLIIYNIFQISVTGDIRFYGLLKTIGVTPRQLKRIIRQQALFLCIVGIPAGLLLGYGVGATLTPVVMARTTFGAGVSTVSTSPLIFFASALFALITVLLSCSRPGKIASKVSPVEATKYTETVKSKKKKRTTRGAKIHQMAFANLGRNKRKTVLVVISLSLSVVLLNILVTFTGGFDMEKYLANLCDENTPTEYMQFQLSESHDVDYTVCAYVTVPHSMSFRYYTTGYSFVLPIEKLNHDSRQESIPMFYLFDTPDDISEASAENYLADLTANDLSELMYESKATLRAEFEDFQNMFLLLGGLLCAIIGLVGVLNFFNAMMTGILSRHREFAVLQAVGMTNRQLKTMLIYEGLFYAMSSVAAAFILSLAVGPLAGKMLGSMFWFFEYRFTILPVLLTIPVFLLLGWLIPCMMYDNTAKCSVVEQLRDAQ